ncbi:hypothetical protein BU15DRAFT_68285 [Melanogaster broomeanus]|nr:hypothetical protein BU15DRAFT_68285 [Melanogaster broomeanus]
MTGFQLIIQYSSNKKCISLQDKEYLMPILQNSFTSRTISPGFSVWNQAQTDLEHYHLIGTLGGEDSYHNMDMKSKTNWPHLPSCQLSPSPKLLSSVPSPSQGTTSGSTQLYLGTIASSQNYELLMQTWRAARAKVQELAQAHQNAAQRFLFTLLSVADEKWKLHVGMDLTRGMVVDAITTILQGGKAVESHFSEWANNLPDDFNSPLLVSGIKDYLQVVATYSI